MGGGGQEAWICGSWGFAFKWFGVSGAKGHPSHPSTQTPRRGRERRCYQLLAARAQTFSCIHNVAKDQKSELSLFCQVCHDKMLGGPHWRPLPSSLTHTIMRVTLIVKRSACLTCKSFYTKQWHISVQNVRGFSFMCEAQFFLPFHTNWQVKSVFAPFTTFLFGLH